MLSSHGSGTSGVSRPPLTEPRIPGDGPPPRYRRGLNSVQARSSALPGGVQRRGGQSSGDQFHDPRRIIGLADPKQLGRGTAGAPEKLHSALYAALPGRNHLPPLGRDIDGKPRRRAANGNSRYLNRGMRPAVGNRSGNGQLQGFRAYSGITLISLRT